MKKISLPLICFILLASGTVQAAPPFSGTIFIDPDIITEADQTTFISAPYAGQGIRAMADRRAPTGFVTVNAFLFNATFDDGLAAEVQVNPEFGDSTAAGIEANKYATAIGRIPAAVRKRISKIMINKGNEPFGGGFDYILIHIEQADSYVAAGILVETFVHEAGHTSLDPQHAAASGWLAAQSADPEFISTYARDFPDREDISESFLTWLAVRYRADRISGSVFNTITSTIPNRLVYFDNQNFNLYPLVAVPSVKNVTWNGNATLSNWTSNANWAAAGGANARDNLVFAGGANRRNNNNDFAANTIFESIEFSDCSAASPCDYNITGNAIFLTRSLLANPGGGTSPIFNPSIVVGVPSSPSTNVLIGMENGNPSPFVINGLVDLNGHGLVLEASLPTSQLIMNGKLVGSGTLRNSGAGTVVLNGNSAGFGTTLTVGSGTLQVSGTGTIGPVLINGGTLQANGTLGLVTLGNGTLRGTGTVGGIDGDNPGSTGTIAPGSGGTATGNLTSNGDVSLSAPIEFEVNLNGPAVVTQHDRLAVNGGVNLNGANLSVALGAGFTPAAGQTFTILVRSGAGTVSGQFAQGSSITAGGKTFLITYSANNVVLTVQAPPSPTPTATPTPTPAATATPTATPGLVGNVATRLSVGLGENILIEGFIVQGPAGSTKKILVRAIGPSLLPFGIADALANPTLEINNETATVATNNDWKTTQSGGLITADQAGEINSSGLAPSNDFESAVIVSLAPGNYTAAVKGFANTTGTGVVDAYDLSASSPARLANVATRGVIQAGDKLMIAGFIIQTGDVRAVVRAIGPSLVPFGINNALPDTTLEVRDQNATIVIQNDDWQSDPAQKQQLEDIGLQPSDPLEAAVIATLPPGQYTAQVRGKPETTGIGVVQVYFLQ
jgi:hypothetical protein